MNSCFLKTLKDDEKPDKSDKKPKKKKVIEISDDEEDTETKLKKEKEKKKAFNERLFEQLSKKVNKDSKKESKTRVDPNFAAELEKLKVSCIFGFRGQVLGEIEAFFASA